MGAKENVLPSSTTFCFLTFPRKKIKSLQIWFRWRQFSPHPSPGLITKLRSCPSVYPLCIYLGMSTDSHWSMQQLNCNIPGKTVSKLLTSGNFTKLCRSFPVFIYGNGKKIARRICCKSAACQSPWEKAAVNLSHNLKKKKYVEKDI